MSKPIELQCTAVSIKNVTPTVFELRFKANQPLVFKAGQFISIVIPGAGPHGRDLRRAYSIASTPEDELLCLCVKLVEGGPGSNFLYRLKPGEQFKAFAPYGDFVLKTSAERQACFIATGTGLAPFHSMIFSAQFAALGPKRSLVFFGARTEDEILFDERFRSLKGSVEWRPVFSRPSSNWTGEKGRVTDLLRNLPSSTPWEETDFYLCGNGAMIEEVKKILADRGVQKSQIFQEVYYKPKAGEA